MLSTQTPSVISDRKTNLGDQAKIENISLAHGSEKSWILALDMGLK